MKNEFLLSVFGVCSIKKKRSAEIAVDLDYSIFGPSNFEVLSLSIILWEWSALHRLVKWSIYCVLLIDRLLCNNYQLGLRRTCFWWINLECLTLFFDWPNSLVCPVPFSSLPIFIFTPSSTHLLHHSRFYAIVTWLCRLESWRTSLLSLATIKSILRKGFNLVHQNSNFASFIPELFN